MSDGGSYDKNLRRAAWPPRPAQGVRHKPANPSRDEECNAHVPVEPCELPDGIQLVYADDRDRRHAVAASIR
jgi:hypothetical protein